jgi:DNA-binding IclR family transcriptional regulator
MPEPPSEAPRAGIHSVEVAARLLHALLDGGEPLRLADLARHAGMPSAKAHRYLVSLIRAGLAAQDPTSGRYDLGPLALRIGLHGIARFEPLRLAEQTIASLSAQAGESAALSVWAGRAPAIVRVAEARHSLAGQVPLGHACPLTWSATGLIFAAFEPAARTAPLLHEELRQNRRVARPGAPRTAASLEARLDDVRRDGVAAVDGAQGGAAAVAAPVHDAQGALAMVVTVFGPQGRLDARPEGPLARLVVQAAKRLSGLLGGATNRP